MLRPVFAFLIFLTPSQALDLPRDYVRGTTGQFTQGGLVVLALTKADKRMVIDHRQGLAV